MKGTELRKILEERILLLDGAMGTLIRQRAVSGSAEALALTRPEAIARIHGEYIDAGADVILTCTFGANRARLARESLSAFMVEINRRAMELARRSADGKALVAACLGPLGERLSQQEATAIYAEQLDILLEHQPDMVVIETQTALAEIQAAVTACRALDSDIALVAQMTFLGDGPRTCEGLRPQEAFMALRALSVDVLGVNCMSPYQVLRLLESSAPKDGEPLSVEPHAGIATVAEAMISPEVMAAYAERFVSLGARIVGTCCGSTPEHTRAIARRLKGDLKSRVSNLRL